ncbi:MAG: putative porin [Candidatus Latescibacterota bacterium]
MKHKNLTRALVLISVMGIVPSVSHSQGQIAFSTGDIVFKGDLRYRHEQISQEGSKQRDRERIRARFNLTATVDPKINLIIGLASDSSTDPISRNQDLGAGFSTKSVWLDMAYIDWTTPLAGLKVQGGKMKNPFLAVGRNQLIWDHDLTPEGLAAQYSKKSNTTEFFANASYFWIAERSAGKENYLFGGQAGINQTMKTSLLTLGVSLYDYTNAKGYDTFVDAAKNFGNSVDAAKKYLYDFRVAEGFGQMSVIGVLPVPASIYFNYATNTASDVEDNTAYLVGATIGKAAQKGSMGGQVFYRYVEHNAVVGAFSDSDFGGGGTNNKGFVFQYDYQYAKNVTLSTTFYMNKLGVKDINGVAPKDYNRLQIDAVAKF